MRTGRNCGLTGLGSMVLAATAIVMTAGAQQIPTAPPEEISEAVRRAAPLIAEVKGNEQAMLTAMRPYGPLYLNPGIPTTAKEFENLAAAWSASLVVRARVPSTVFANPLRRGFCGDPCTDQLQKELVPNLPRLRTIIRRFEQMRGLDVVAAWPGDDFRVGDVVCRRGEYARSLRSPALKLEPWQYQPLEESIEKWLEARSTSLAKVKDLLVDMRETGIAAIRRGPDGSIRCATTASAHTHEIGVLAPARGGASPRMGDTVPDGRHYGFTRDLGSGLVLYGLTYLDLGSGGFSGRLRDQ